MTDESAMIPVYPEPGDGDYKLYAVSWLSSNGELYTRLIGAVSPVNAAAVIAQSVDHSIRHHPHASIDVRECSPVHTYASRVVVV